MVGLRARGRRAANSLCASLRSRNVPAPIRLERRVRSIRTGVFWGRLGHARDRTRFTASSLGRCAFFRAHDPTRIVDAGRGAASRSRAADHSISLGVAAIECSGDRGMDEECLVATDLEKRDRAPHRVADPCRCSLELASALSFPGDARQRIDPCPSTRELSLFRAPFLVVGASRAAARRRFWSGGALHVYDRAAQRFARSAAHVHSHGLVSDLHKHDPTLGVDPPRGPAARWIDHVDPSRPGLCHCRIGALRWLAARIRKTQRASERCARVVAGALSALLLSADDSGRYNAGPTATPQGPSPTLIRFSSLRALTSTTDTSLLAPFAV